MATMIGCLPTQAIAFEWKPRLRHLLLLLLLLLLILIISAFFSLSPCLFVFVLVPVLVFFISRSSSCFSFSTVWHFTERVWLLRSSSSRFILVFQPLSSSTSSSSSSSSSIRRRVFTQSQLEQFIYRYNIITLWAWEHGLVRSSHNFFPPEKKNHEEATYSEENKKHYWNANNQTLGTRQSANSRWPLHRLKYVLHFVTLWPWSLTFWPNIKWVARTPGGLSLWQGITNLV